MSAQGGFCPAGVFARGRGVSDQGVSAQRRCLTGGGVSDQEGV